MNNEQITTLVRQLSPFFPGSHTQYITNGGHEIWQRGAGPFTSNGAYAADMWHLSKAGTDTLSVTREGTTKKVDSQYASACAFVLGDGAGATQYRQKLTISDNLHGLLGKAISLQIPVKLLAAVASAVRAFITTDGTGGTTTYSSYHGNNTNWEDLTVGATVPTDATYVYVGIAFAASCTAYIDNVTLPAMGYQPLHPSEEWERCQRYYEVFGGNAGTSGDLYPLNVACAATGNHGGPISFTTPKAIVPTLTKTGTWHVANCGQPVLVYPTNKGYLFYAIAVNAGYMYFYPNSADDTVTAEAHP